MGEEGEEGNVCVLSYQCCEIECFVGSLLPVCGLSY